MLCYANLENYAQQWVKSVNVTDDSELCTCARGTKSAEYTDLDISD